MKYSTIVLALINVPVIARLIMIGEHTKLDKQHEDKAQLVSPRQVKNTPNV